VGGERLGEANPPFLERTEEIALSELVGPLPGGCAMRRHEVCEQLVQLQRHRHVRIASVPDQRDTSTGSQNAAHLRQRLIVAEPANTLPPRDAVDAAIL